MSIKDFQNGFIAGASGYLLSDNKGGGDLPEEALHLTDLCQYKFYGGHWDWFLNYCGDKITTENITGTISMFEYSQVSKIKFDINLSNSSSLGLSMDNMFSWCNKLESLPTINVSGEAGTINCKSMFYDCKRLRTIPEDFFTSMGTPEFFESKPLKGYGLFTNCHSLRKLPNLSPFKYSTDVYNFYHGYMFLNCFALDEIVDFPVLQPTNMTQDYMASLGTEQGLSRIKNFTFETDPLGQPYVANWTNQSLRLSSVGYGGDTAITGYNSGISSSSLVYNDDSYQRLKDDPDWYSTNVIYSRYNHDSAVATINSLPDTSAYLATKGGTNTISFKRESGSMTDGGAISTLTSAEIAKATAKGWTVSFV
jgi:hypothetical protein